MGGERTCDLKRPASAMARGRAWPLLALLLCLVAFAPGLAAQSAKLAEDPPRPDDPSASSAAPASPPGDSARKPATSDAAPSDSSSPDKPIDTSAEPPKPPDPSSASEAAAAPAQQEFDPLHAERSLEVGSFYYKKGELDAAVDRFQEAARLNPKLAKPYLFLGEIYEKRSDAPDALTAYRKYLQLFQNAPDRDKIQRRIEKLEGKAGRDAAPAGSG